MKKTTCRRRRRRVKTQLPEGSLLPVWRCSHSQVLQPLASVAAKTWKEKMGKMERERGEGEQGDEDKEENKKDEHKKRKRK